MIQITWAAWTALMLPSHLLAGVRPATAALSSAAAVVIARVDRVEPLPQGASRIFVVPLATPCGSAPTERGTLAVHQVADHAVAYQPGQVAVFPLVQTQDSAHAVVGVPAGAFLVEQAAHEVVHVSPADVPGLGALVSRLCGASGRHDALVDAMASRWSTLSGGAALELATLDAPRLSPAGESRLAEHVVNRALPVPVRVAALGVAARVGGTALERAAAACVTPAEPPELVAAALKVPGLPVPDAALVLVMMGPAGPQRILAARHATGRRSDVFIGPLVALAHGPEPLAASTACKALSGRGPRGEDARNRLSRILPPPRAADCMPPAP